jgi:DNA-binding response OmpR family regulator
MTEKKRVVIIDDDPDILDVLQLTFEDVGFETSVSVHSDEFFGLVDSFSPDIIILDYLLSGKDGTVLTRELKRREKYRHIPVIMISAHPDAKNMAAEARTDGFLAKPFELDDLTGLAATLLEKRIIDT